jgi:hypothetical protein
MQYAAIFSAKTLKTGIHRLDCSRLDARLQSSEIVNARKSETHYRLKAATVADAVSEVTRAQADAHSQNHTAPHVCKCCRA